MILDAFAIPRGIRLECDLCIIGSGAAAITLALEFASQNTSIIVVAGGDYKETSFNTDLYQGSVNPIGSHETLEENRRRVWGGSTSAWGGRCIPFDPIDFVEREWIQNSGWPFQADKLQPFYSRACKVAEAGENDFDARSVFPGTQTEILQGLDNEDIVTWPLERWSPPTHFGKKYQRALAAADNIRVLMNAHCVNLGVQKSTNSIHEISVAYNAEHRFSVGARLFVLATGGLENARLLLASNDILPQGIGNDFDQVGRYYQSHLFGTHGFVKLNKPQEGFVYDFERDSEGVYCRRRFWLTPKAQEQYSIGNAIGFFFRPGIGHAVHRNAVFSATYIAKSLKRVSLGGFRGVSKTWIQDREALMQHFKVVLQDAPAMLPELFRLTRQRFLAKRRLPMILAPRSSNQFYLFFQTEHLPNPESRVVLKRNSRDAFGMPRLEAQIRFGETDISTVKTFYQIMKKRFAATGIGDFIYSEDDLQSQLERSVGSFNSNAHHIGTTRMGLSPQNSVVNPECQIHGIHNLFVAGSSVFPTSGHANPTLTLLALSLRLSDFLKSKFSNS